MSPASAHGWTEDRLTRLPVLWNEGYSASQVATLLGGGITRNAVIGKVHRLGLSRRSKRDGEAKRAERLSPTSRATTPPPRPLARRAEPEPLPLALPAAPAGPGVTIFHLDAPGTQKLCRFIAAEVAGPDETLYCGAPTTAVGEPYCAYHKAKCWTGPQKKGSPAPMPPSVPLRRAA